MPTDSRTSGRNCLARERESKCFELRKAGASYSQIAEAIGMSKQGCQQAVVRVLKNLREEVIESIEDVRAIEVERLDAMLVGLWSRAKTGDCRAVDSVLKIAQRRAEILGLDMPEKHSFTDPTGQEAVSGITIRLVRPGDTDHG